MIWRLFRPKPIVVIELPYEGSVDPKVAEEVIKTLIKPLKKDYHVVFWFSQNIKELKVRVVNGAE
jgi:hypothetical protein